MGKSPRINVRNRQRKIPVNVADLQIFAVKALRRCLQLRKRKPTDLTRLHEVFVWLISDRRMASLHRRFMHRTGPTDVLTFQHGEIFISVETAKKHARAFGNPLTGSFGSTSPMGFYICTGLTIVRRLARAK